MSAWSTTDARKQAVLQAALACFDEQGVEQTSIEAIREKSGVSVGSIYHHFGNKDGIAAELYLEGIRQVADLVEAALADADSAEQGVKGIVTAYLGWITEHRDWAGFIHQQRTVMDETLHTKIGRIDAETSERISNWFAPYLVAGELKKLPAAMYMALVLGPVREYARRWLAGHSVPAPQAFENLFADAAWRAIKR